MTNVDPLEMPFQSSNHQGPADPKHPMHRTYPSRNWIVALCIYGILSVAASLAVIGFKMHGFFEIQSAIDEVERKKEEEERRSEIRGLEDEVSKLREQIAKMGQEGPPGTSGLPASTPTSNAVGAASTGPNGSAANPPPSAQPAGGGDAQAGASAGGEEQAEGQGETGSEGQEEESQPAEPSVAWELYFIAVFAGMLGGSMHLLSSLGKYIGARRLLKSWLPFYFLRPFVGAALGASIFFFIQAGLATTQPQFQSSDQNPYGILLFCTLAGLFSRQALEKLAEVFDNFFRTEKAQPAAAGGPPPPIVGEQDPGKDLSSPLSPQVGEVEDFPDEQTVSPSTPGGAEK